jgi:hypothetical protein
MPDVNPKGNPAPESAPAGNPGPESAPASEAQNETKLKVTSVMATVQVSNDRVIYLYRGDVVPEDATQESVDNLKSLGFVSENDEDVQP